LHKNPTYYGLEISVEEQDSLTAMEAANSFLVEIVDKSVNELVDSGCVVSYSNGDVESTALGKIASYYYLVGVPTMSGVCGWGLTPGISRTKLSGTW
jgi:antiviral helicase SLH1